MTTLWEDLREPPTRRQRWAAVLRKQPSAILLVVQMVVIMSLPWLGSTVYGRTTAFALSAAALILAVVTVRSTPAMTALSVVLAVPALALELWATFGHEVGHLAAIRHGMLAVFYAYTAYALISYMFEDSWVTKDELFAVGACFTVLVFAFAYLYLALQEFYPGSFTSVDGPGQRSFLELIYYSGANLTSVGLSDIVAIKPQARAFSTIEQLGGVMYVAMVISRLVALTVMRQRS